MIVKAVGITCEEVSMAAQGPIENRLAGGPTRPHAAAPNREGRGWAAAMRNLARRFCLIGAFVTASAGLGLASPIVVNFDAINASGGQVSGATLDAYLAGYGITVSHVSGPAGPAVANAATSAFLYPQFFGPPSKQNFIWQPGSNGPIGYRLNFSQPLASLSFTRAAMDPEQSITGMIAAEWTARVLDAGGNTIGTVGEPNYASYTPVDPATFTFSTPGIVALVVERSKQIVSPTPTTVTSPPLDNLTFQISPVPEPASVRWIGLGALALALGRCRLRRRPPQCR